MVLGLHRVYSTLLYSCGLTTYSQLHILLVRIVVVVRVRVPALLVSTFFELAGLRTGLKTRARTAWVCVRGPKIYCHHRPCMT